MFYEHIVLFFFFKYYYYYCSYYYYYSTLQYTILCYLCYMVVYYGLANDIAILYHANTIPYVVDILFMQEQCGLEDDAGAEQSDGLRGGKRLPGT